MNGKHKENMHCLVSVIFLFLPSLSSFAFKNAQKIFPYLFYTIDLKNV